jgi:hypothetical protein
MSAPKPVLIVTSETIVPRDKMLYCLCGVCANELNWRHFDSSFELHATCCCHAFRARPHGNKMGAYFIDAKPCNMQNVYFLERKSRLEGLQPPPQRLA